MERILELRLVLFACVLLLILSDIVSSSDNFYSSISETLQLQTYNKTVDPFEDHQASKLEKMFGHIKNLDMKIELETIAHFSRKHNYHHFKGKSVLCVGARLGGEVRGFMQLGALAIGYDFNPGKRNAWVVYGKGAPMQFANQTFDYVFTNIIDHITNLTSYFAEVHRVLKHLGIYIMAVDQNAPDEYSVRDNRGEASINMLLNTTENSGLKNVLVEYPKEIVYTSHVRTVMIYSRKLA